MTKHILIVEDEPNIIESLSFLLERAGFTVSSEQDGGMAMKQILAQKPDLVILDVMLPGKSGMDILRDLREREEWNNLPVLMLTARGQSRDREMAEKAGVSRFMTKPFSNIEVLTAVRDLHAQATRT